MKRPATSIWTGFLYESKWGMRAVNAKRIAIDSIEALFSGFSDEFALRAEIRRLFRWLKEKGLTAVVTGEKGESSLTRYGLEEYLSDCVIFLDHRMEKQVATRRIRVVKYRGTTHGTNEYPFLITEKGFTIYPVTSLGLDYPVTDKRVSTGIERLDAMLGGQGYYRGTSVLVSGTAGTGKSSLGACFVNAACLRGEKALYFSFEEPPQQIIRNMGCIGIDLKTPLENKLLQFYSMRSTTLGLEAHLSMIIKHITDFNASIVVIDPITNMQAVSNNKDAKEALTRLIDYIKMKEITAMFIDLTHGGNMEATSVEISSLMDTWLVLRDIEYNAERTRGMYVIKSRGMEHSNQLREFLITDDGINLQDVYVGSAGVLTGTARFTQEAIEAFEASTRDHKIELLRRDMIRKESIMNNQIKELRDNFEFQKEELKHSIAEIEAEENMVLKNKKVMFKMRRKD